MNTEKLAAGVLVAACLVAAAGSWFSGLPKTAEDGKPLKGMFNDAGTVARLDISGMILDEGGGGFGGGGTTSGQALLKQIAKIRADGCKAVLLKLNTPGGTASGAQEVYDELVRLKTDKHVKIVASMGDLAASGGYYIAAAADEIIANPSTITGSIGVIMHTQNWQGLMGKIGIENGAIKSAPMKDIGSPDRPMTPEEHKVLQDMINDTYDQFLDAVSTGRKIPKAQLKALADGRVFTGRQAQKVHLVDKLGNIKFAEREVRTLAGLPEDAKIKDYGEEDWKSMVGELFSRSNVHPLSAIMGTQQAIIQSGALNKVPLMLYE
ncbi:MAG: sppA [Cyanobacteria bacterium RYN_339]|nr:sppA [Cyanobacteria bacterium RYN_339]